MEGKIYKPSDLKMQIPEGCISLGQIVGTRIMINSAEKGDGKLWIMKGCTEKDNDLSFYTFSGVIGKKMEIAVAGDLFPQDCIVFEKETKSGMMLDLIDPK